MTLKQSESGRSMVEMLGTLAIIGVLSIGGIAGYSYGMDKYRANTIMNDITLRSVDLIAQKMRGGTPNLSEWPTITAGKYPIGLESNSTGIQVEDLPERICQMVFDGMINDATIKVGATEYNTPSDDVCGDTNTMVFYFEGGATTTPDVPTGEQCGSTICGTCQKCENETCVTVSDYEQACTADNGKTGWCVSGACQPDTTCNCGPNQYCVDKNMNGGNSKHPTPSGQCKDLDFRDVDIDGTTYYISNQTMSWWDATSACAVLGKRMISYKLVVQDCGVPHDDSCKRTALGQALYEQGWGNSGNPWIWSSIVDSSYRAYDVGLNVIVVSFDERHNIRRDYAVCR